MYRVKTTTEIKSELLRLADLIQEVEKPKLDYQMGQYRDAAEELGWHFIDMGLYMAIIIIPERRDTVIKIDRQQGVVCGYCFKGLDHIRESMAAKYEAIFLSRLSIK